MVIKTLKRLPMALIPITLEVALPVDQEIVMNWAYRAFLAI